MSASGRFPNAPETGRLIFDGVSMRWDASAPKLVDPSALSPNSTTDGRLVAAGEWFQQPIAIPMPNDRYLESKRDLDKLSSAASLVTLNESVSVALEPEISQLNRF